MFGDLASNAMTGLQAALQPESLMFCFIGVSLGTLLGIIPGIGALAAISMLFPITFYLEPTNALIMLAGIYYGTTYGGSTASILLNMPGTPSNAVVCLDGYPMAQQGRAGVALFMTTIASFVGGTVGIVAIMVFSPVIVEFSSAFGAAEYFSLMVLGLVSASSIVTGPLEKSLIMVCAGILFGLVGTDIYTGTTRYTFGTLELADGLSLVALAMGFFGVAEVIDSIKKLAGTRRVIKVSTKSLYPTRQDLRASIGPILRGSWIGAFFGALPGTGGTVASFMSYAIEKRVSSTPERFGKGAIEGVVGPETANNAADQTAFIPTLTLGIPGTATMALMLGVLIIHGIVPGPRLMTDEPQLFWGLIMSFWIGNILLMVLNIPLIGLFVRVLTIPYSILYPAILMFVCIGVYSVRYSPTDVCMVAGFGVLGYIGRQFGYASAPLLLGYVLGPLLEENLRRAMIISRGDLATFIERPLSLAFLLLTLVIALAGIFSTRRNKFRTGSTKPDSPQVTAPREE